jgi:hypothetical protein
VRDLVVGLDGPAVIVPAELVRPVRLALAPVLDRARGAPLARPLADFLANLERAERAAAMRAVVSVDGHAAKEMLASVGGKSDCRLREISVADAHELLGGKPSTRQLCRLAESGALPARKVGRTWLLDARAVEALRMCASAPRG